MIIAHELEKKYGQHTALDNVSVRVEAGSIVGFVGPNGAGKSTTLRIIAGLESADSGISEIDGERSGRLSSPWSKMGTLLDRQGVNGELTAVRAVRALGEAYGVPSSEMEEILDTVDLMHAKNRKVKTFSLGMKQRLNLALALIAHPDYLLLDEPMNGLDPDGIMWLREFFGSFRDEGGGILLSSHTLTEVEAVADEIVVIKEGRTVWAGGTDRMSGASGSVVAADDNGRLVDVLRRREYEFSSDSDLVHVAAVEPGTLGRVLYEEGVVVTHLTEERTSLEQLYLSLKGNGEN
ncbi:ATP-binding cassette domain-containing protein [Actinomyces gerencseriae]|uniref:ATP-binding cassette domain-containing protein n=1 Tax=Actinomyces gerencseriae TaxID=52769 RepID=UPI0003F78C93|nr:ATP-binding cassette domain-containing protein [Actinomyces gerencseriae]